MEQFLGEIKLVPYNFAPTGWAFCNGQLISIPQNTALFALIGTKYGGDGRLTFALPDLRGRAVISRGQGSGTSDYAIGDKTGAEDVILTVTTMPAHSHSVQASADPASSSSPVGLYMGVAGSSVGNVYGSTVGTTMPAGIVGAAGGPLVPHENLQPYLPCNYIIALLGVFPQRN